MDPLTQNKLDELLELTRENNKILRKIRRGQVWRTVIRVIYWVLIIASVYGAYKYLGPSLKSLYSVYTSGLGEGIEGSNTSLLKNFSDISEIQSLLEKYNLK